VAVAVAAVEEATKARWRLVVLLALFLVRRLDDGGDRGVAAEDDGGSREVGELGVGPGAA